jgi:hypothetical protein
MRCTQTSYRYILVALLISSAAGSCRKNWLDAKPSQNVTVPSSLQDFQALLDNNYAINYTWSPTLGEIASDGHYVTDALFNSSLSAYEKDAYTWTHTYPYLGIQDWATMYTGIYYCNLVLQGLAGVAPGNATDQASWNNVKGEALFLRGLMVFELAQEYAPAYDSATAATDLGVPMRLSTDILIPTVRSTVTENYTQIIGDLSQAKDLLAMTEIYPSRPSKPAAYAALARVFISVGDYSDSYANADSCLSLYNTLLNYNTLNPNSGGNPPAGQYNSEVLFHSQLDYPVSLQYCLIDTALYNLYDSNDLRKVIFFTINPDSTISFQGTYTNEIYILFSGLATDEVYLNRAESSARLGNTGAAMADLNTLLSTRYATGTFVARTAANADSALSQILVERKKELLLRGIRWSDLRRLSKDRRFAITITRTVDGAIYTLAPNSYEYTFPIPDDIIQQSGIQQNPGW